MKRRVISFCMCVVMCVTMLPMKTWAEIKSNKSLYASNSNEVEGSVIDYSYFLEKNDSIHNLYGSQKTASAFNPEGWLWPVKDNRAVYSPYNVGFSNLIAKRGREHKGIDISYNGDLLIFAAKAGTVIDVYNSCTHHKDPKDKCEGGIGNGVRIRHDDGSISIYAHMKKDSIVVKKNQVVRQGEPIGITGASGSAEGIHLHFAILFNNTLVNVNPKSNTYITSNNKRQYSNQEICLGGTIDYIYNAALYEELPPPAKPTVRTDKTSYLAGDMVTISWDAVAHNSNYAINVYRNGTLTYEANLGNQNYYTIPNAGVGTYVVYVSANNSAGSAGSDPYTFTVEELTVPEKPILSPTNSVYAPGESVTFTWSTAARNEFFWISIIKDDVLIVNQGLDYTQSYTLTNMEVGNYVVYVSANNSAGTSGSAWCTFTVGQITVPETPTVAGAKSTYYESESVGIGWNEVANCDSYTIQIIRNGQPIVEQNVGKTVAYTLNNPEEGYYVVYVWANNGVGSSEHGVWSFRAVKETYYLNLYANINGQNQHDFSNCGMVDVFVNGMLAAYHVGNYYIELPYGTTYEVRSITPLDGYSYDGLHSGTRFGTVLSNTDVGLTFRSALPSLLETPKVGVFNGHTYYYFHTPVTWYDAKSICENMGGHLVTINSAEENQFVAGFADYSSLFWLGATDAATEGTWQWITGEPFSYVNWAENQPDNYAGDEGAENYLLNADANGNWVDICGCTPFLFICEIDAAGYTISFDANSGTGIMSGLEADYGQSVALPGNDYVKPGYAFSGWHVQRNSDGRWYATGDKFVSDSELAAGAVKKLYANGADVCFINYDGSDGYTFVAVWEKDFIQGNLNGDTIIDVTDMACLFDYLSAGKLSGAYQNDPAYFKAVADVNEDGTVNILDYQALYELVKSDT